MQGVDLIRVLRADTRCIDMPIVAIGATPAAGDPGECVTAGANLFVPKSDLCADAPGWVGRIAELGSERRVAA
jgi:CheY-like chemotaxis protein